MIKKIFITLLSVIGLGISFSSAYNCNGQLIQCDGLEFGQVPNNRDGIFNGTVSDNRFNFSAVNSKYFLSKIDNKIVLYYWWQNDGLHYTSQYYNGNNKENGKINGYFVCSQLPNLGYQYGLYTYNYCVYNSGFNSFSSNVKDIDTYSFNCGHSVSTSNCIVCAYKNGGDSYYCIDTSYKTVLGSNLLNSNTIEELATENPYIRGGNNNRNNNTICPTLGQILNNYPTNYNTGICYNNTIIYNNNQIETIDKRNIQQIFTDYEERSNRRNIYNNNCKAIFTRETCMNAFSGNLDKYEIISKGVNENAEPKRLRNYCNIYLNYDLNTSSCVASGRQEKNFTTEEIINTILTLDNLTIQTPTTGNILNELLNEGEERANPFDILDNIDQIKDKFTILFEERKGVNGIIPNYIIWIMLLTILLTVLFKK